jgi:hypothetical protein
MARHLAFLFSLAACEATNPAVPPVAAPAERAPSATASVVATAPASSTGGSREDPLAGYSPLPAGSDAVPVVARVGVATIVLVEINKFGGFGMPMWSDNHYVRRPRWRRYVEGFDGDTGKPLWTSPIEVTALRHSYGVSGDRLFVGVEADVKVFDVQTGAPVGQVHAVPGSICVADDGNVSVVDAGVAEWKFGAEARVVMDPRSLALRPSNGTERCRAHQAMYTWEWGEMRKHGVVRGAFIDDAHTALIGVDKADVLTVVRLDARTLAERFRAVVPSAYPEHTPPDVRAAEMQHGRLLVEYDDWLHDTRLAAFDAVSGSRLWDVGLPEHAGLAMTETRVYVEDSKGFLRLLDATTGARLG